MLNVIFDQRSIKYFSLNHQQSKYQLIKFINKSVCWLTAALLLNINVSPLFLSYYQLNNYLLILYYSTTENFKFLYSRNGCSFRKIPYFFWRKDRNLTHATAPFIRIVFSSFPQSTFFTSLKSSSLVTK